MGAVTATCYSDGVRTSYRCIAQAMHDGIRACGDDALLTHRLVYRRAHVGVMYGWKFNAVLRQHPRFVYADLGYWHRERYWRLAANAWSPVKAMPRSMPADRFVALNVAVLPEHRGEYVLVLGASRKSMREHGYAHTQWEARVCEKLLRLGARVLFRPKPKDPDAHPIHGTEYAAHGSLEALFAGASLVVAHHSNACLEAVAAGCAVHCVTGIASERSVPLNAWRDPPRVHGREQLLADAAYAQWTLDEMRSGAAWRCIRGGTLQ